MKSRFWTAFGVGWFVYMVAMVLTAYEDITSMIIQAFMAAITSAAFVLLAHGVGVLVRLSHVRTAWDKMGVAVLILSVVGVAMLIFASDLGFMKNAVDPDTGATMRVMKLPAGIGAYLLIIFPFANWPPIPCRHAEPGAPPNGGPATLPADSGAQGGPPSVS